MSVFLKAKERINIMSEKPVNVQKLNDLIKKEGCDDLTDLLTRCIGNSAVPAICVNPGCDHSTTMEPDQAGGYCETCKDNTVVSCLVLAGVI
jgi:hypothetical protein